MAAERLLAWLDKNSDRLLLVGVLWLAAVMTLQLALTALGHKTIEDVAREEVREWLVTHNITVVVQQPRTVELPENLFYLLVFALLFMPLVGAILRDR
ncbi:hypothetical protein Pyrde_0078 [Pyrodictium delaneyi]|uniref:Uncharacterized protein n=1 Tax=Pyrodictium delaneyi TaxID=1273541 RepID=A0A0P0N1K3_9CREN|nr:hypothetical protein [Pyrodictium delaneyi]ALL00128.1 hypothetical protein Pyrde_0078 [Pyrodictium delaneyi]